MFMRILPIRGLLVCDITWTPDGWPMAKLE